MTLGKGQISLLGFAVEKRVIAPALISTLMFGITGLGYIILMWLFANFTLGKNSVDSHGIAHSESSRLGGLVIGIVFISYIAGLMVFSPYTPGVVRSYDFAYIWSAVFICCMLGLAEDLNQTFCQPIRLGAKFLYLVYCFFWYHS